MWGSSHPNRNGTALIEWLVASDFVMLNTTQPTHISDSDPNTWSLLDLCVASTRIAHKCNTVITADFLGSDHCIVFTNIDERVVVNNTYIPRWSLQRADWSAFHNICDDKLNNQLLVSDLEKSIENITENL